MTIHKDYEITINLNDLIEERIPCCDLSHPEQCFTEKQVSEIANKIRVDLNLHDIYKQSGFQNGCLQLNSLFNIVGLKFEQEESVILPPCCFGRNCITFLSGKYTY